MMSNPSLKSSAIAAIVLWLVHAGPSASLAARFHNVDLSVKHQNFGASPNDFSLTALLTGRSDDAGPIASGRLISPTGIVFNSSTTTIRRSSLAAIDELLTGSWTAFETLDGVESSYQFHVAPNSLDGIPSGLPIIISPRNGATVGRTFDVRWNFDDNDRPGSVGLFTVNDPALQFTGLTVPPGSENTLRISTQLLAPGPRSIDELQIYRTYSLASPMFTSSSPELAGDQFDLDATFDAISDSISLNVIPEPGGIAKFVILSLCFALRGQRASARGLFHR